jgi:hypothetical protein
MFERLATNKDVDVEKLDRLIAMQERILAHNARSDYYAAFAAMQGDLPVVTERGEIAVNGVVRSKYARNEDIQDAIRPILQRHGFALSFRNEFKDGLVTITGILAHRSGHAEQDQFVAKADDSGSKNAIQALGSTRSYGQRYTTIALLNIATRGEDDDGRRSEKAGKPAAPAGYDDWLTEIAAVADEGELPLKSAWNQSKPLYRNHITKADPLTWAALKAKALSVGGGK